jgi:hypothetical protein
MAVLGFGAPFGIAGKLAIGAKDGNGNKTNACDSVADVQEPVEGWDWRWSEEDGDGEAAVDMSLWRTAEQKAHRYVCERTMSILDVALRPKQYCTTSAHISPSALE